MRVDVRYQPIAQEACIFGAVRFLNWIANAYYSVFRLRRFCECCTRHQSWTFTLYPSASSVFQLEPSFDSRSTGLLLDTGVVEWLERFDPFHPFRVSRIGQGYERTRGFQLFGLPDEITIIKHLRFWEKLPVHGTKFTVHLSGHICLVGFGLWHIKLLRLFNAKSILYI